jgi:hypothetical protein
MDKLERAAVHFLAVDGFDGKLRVRIVSIGDISRETRTLGTMEAGASVHGDLEDTAKVRKVLAQLIFVGHARSKADDVDEVPLDDTDIGKMLTLVDEAAGAPLRLGRDGANSKRGCGGWSGRGEGGRSGGKKTA